MANENVGEGLHDGGFEGGGGLIAEGYGNGVSEGRRMQRGVFSGDEVEESVV